MNDKSTNLKMEWGTDMDFDTAFQLLVSEVFRFRGALLSAGDQATRDLNITVGCWQAMAVIRDEAMTVANISRRLGLTRQSVQLSANRLRDQKLVESIPNPNHRRAPLIQLTSNGIKTMDILRKRQSQMAARFTQNLDHSIESLITLAEDLSKMREKALELKENNTIRKKR